ncbi:hypothetical protein AMECASPLE_001887 [Ameca splendens]|uniref:Uncharacterized protein n=1 Tax=Ameca splendens TaxID=208324 RepID=A0ABV0YWU7_9TELE
MSVMQHPSIFYMCFCTGSRGSWCLSPAVYRQEARYTLDRSQSKTDTQDKQPCTRLSQLPILGRERTHAWGEHAKSMQKDPQPGVKPRTFLRQDNSVKLCATIRLLM